MQLTKKESMTSLELLKEINIFREKEDKTELGHNDLLKVIRDEFEEEISQGKISQSNYYSRGKEYPMFILTLGQSKQVLSRESKFVRKAVIQYIENLEKELKEVLPQLSEMEMIVKIANSQIAMDKKFIEMDNKIDSVINAVTLESGKQRIVQLRVSKKVYNIMSEYLGENVMEYNIKQRKLFSSIYRDLKRKFGVASYKDIKVVEYEKALEFINNWIEDVI
jgi:hypothetical protein